MITAVLLGAGAGLGVFLVAKGLFWSRPSLAQELARLRRLPSPAPVVTQDTGGFAARLGQPVADVIGRAGYSWIIPTSIRGDLVVLGRGAQRHLAEKAALGIVGLLLAPALTALLTLGGVNVSILLPLWAALVLMIAGFLIPDFGVHAEANRYRRDFRHALSCFLDLVVISLAGGGGVETALTDAASVGDSWAFSALRRALDQARLNRETPWTALGRLGEELGIPELVELAASVALAGTQGAKVRASLAAKATSLRTHQLADAETADQAATERMSLPVVLLFAGFLVFLGYPAVERVLQGI